MVLLDEREFLEIRFPNADPALGVKLAKVVRKALPTEDKLTVPLDFIMANIERTKKQARTIEVNLQPPPIFRSETPAILVMFMGEPALAEIKGTQLMFVTNTNWDVFLDKRTGRYYLRNGASWLATGDLQKGSWAPAPLLPEDLAKLPDDKNWEDVKKHLPGEKAASIPKVFVSLKPAELILSDGVPQFVPISGTRLMYAKNTDSDLFMLVGEGNYYFLTAGRWFRSASLDGPWKPATNDLPAEFRKIPDDHVKGDVLANVPGTPESEEAVIMASVPRKVSVNKDEATVTVVYDGAPKFIVIDGTAVYFALNSPQDVFRVEGKYYCCYQGVWFQAAAAAGPWAVCTAVPAVIYKIPSNHPKHNVTYVYVYSSTPSTVVVGYTSGYTGCYVAYGAVMFGLGYWAAHAHHHHHYHYHSHYYGYGCHAHYNHHTGTYHRGASVYGPYGGAGRGAAYNPHTGTYSRGAYAYGPNGSRYARQAYNPRTGTRAVQRGGTTPYGSWNQTAVRRGNEWARGGSASRDGTTLRGFETSRGAAGIGKSGPGGASGALRTRSGDVYVGKDGDIYKKSGDSWQKREGNSWSNVDRSAGAGTTGTGRSTTEAGRSTTEAGRSGSRPSSTDRSASRADVDRGLSRDSRARSRGNSNARRYRSSSGSRYSRGGGGGRRR
jgi:hypothetical protein